MKQLVILAACGVLLGGCATIVRGTTNKVEIKSNPEGIEVVTSSGHSCVTPCMLTIPRKEEFIVTYKPKNKKPFTVPVRTKVSGAGAASLAGNVLVGGIIGGGVDVATGAGLDHYPNPVFHDFKAPPAEKPKQAPRQKSRPARTSTPTS